MTTFIRSVFSVLAVAASLVLSLPATVQAQETIKVRVLDVDQRKNEVKVDVRGQTRTYTVTDRSLYRQLVPGRLAIITANLVGGRHTIVEARIASYEGRVTGVDDRLGTATIALEDGTNNAYYFENESWLRRVRTGDRVSIEFEERPGRRVITSLDRVGGGGGIDLPSGGSASGRVNSLDRGRDEIVVVLSTGRREELFRVARRSMLDNLNAGDVVDFDYEQRSGRPVITSLRRRGDGGSGWGGGGTDRYTARLGRIDERRREVVLAVENDRDVVARFDDIRVFDNLRQGDRVRVGVQRRSGELWILDITRY